MTWMPEGVILYGAFIATPPGRLGIGKEENYSYDIYEVEFIPEALFGVSYHKSLTTLFPRFLNVMADAHGVDIRGYLEDAFGYTGDLATSTDRLIDLFRELGADMYFDGEVKEEQGPFASCGIPVVHGSAHPDDPCVHVQSGGVCAKELIEGKTDVFCGKNLYQ